MAFVVETGAGVPNANSYASVSAADGYVADRGIEGWATLSNTAKEQALIKATDYLEATYRDAFKGYRIAAAQTLSWPRSNVIVDGFLLDANIVPTPVINSCIEMALRAAGGETLIADQGQRVKREKIDVIEIEYQDYSDPAARYPFINRMLLPYVTSGSTAALNFIASAHDPASLLSSIISSSPS
jgi:hypothetical protein